jgi:NADPH-dependent 2,4-dienoyl-CoA reductase/sulfur reductase-like enzyme
VAGSGPLLLAVADYLRKRGASVPLIAEQAAWAKLIPFTAGLMRHPGKLAQAAALKLSLGATPFVPGSWIESAEGDGKLERVRVRSGSKAWTEPCDYLAVAYGFQPNDELAVLLGCETRRNCVGVDEFQRTSVEGIYCAGESTGIGGVDLSLVEGQIAGLSAGGRDGQARNLFPQRASALQFANALNRTFAPRAELRSLANEQTFVCRCEDVTLGRLKTAGSWRAAKLHLRCGMGPCQGRICGPAVQFLFGWQLTSVRPPVFPARVGSLISKGAKQ